MARSGVQAAQELVQAFQHTISCVADAVVIHDGDVRPTVIHALRFSENPMRLPGTVPLLISMRQTYRLVRDPDARSSWAVVPESYWFELQDAAGRELLGFHWHPEGRGSVSFPHLHVGGASEGRDDMIAKAHIPTGTITLPEVLRLAIADLGVRPRRGDWAATLDSAYGRLSSR